MPARPALVPRLYLITDRRASSASLPEVVARALSGAERFRAADGRLPVAVQLREKDLPVSELLALARAVVAVTRAAGASLYINDRVDVALAAGADGVHLPATGLAALDVRRFAPALKLARSTHLPDEIGAAGPVDFVVFGPVLDTPSKRGLLAPRGMEGLRAAAGRGVPVLALGGIAPTEVAGCLAAGAAGVACIRAVWSSPDPGRVVGAFLHELSRT